MQQYSPTPPPQQTPMQDPYPMPEQPSARARAPYYMPPYYPIPPRTKGPPMYEVDRSLPNVPFKLRPRAYKIAIVLIIIGVILCLGAALFLFSFTLYFFISYLFFVLFIIIGMLGIISIILLLIPKKIGWYIAFITGIIALSGLGIGTIIGSLVINALLWPSIRYYFHTGHYPPLPMPYHSLQAQPQTQPFPTPGAHPNIRVGPRWK